MENMIQNIANTLIGVKIFVILLVIVSIVLIVLGIRAKIKDEDEIAHSAMTADYNIAIGVLCLLFTLFIVITILLYGITI
jgi:heme/copper-type cytochrome/quinol oxidase subunit 2